MVLFPIDRDNHTCDRVPSWQESFPVGAPGRGEQCAARRGHFFAYHRPFAGLVGGAFSCYHLTSLLELRPLDLGGCVIIYWSCRIIPVMEKRQPPCLIPTLDSNPPLVTGPSEWGFIFPPQNVVLVLLSRKWRLRDGIPILLPPLWPTCRKNLQLMLINPTEMVVFRIDSIFTRS